jgi:hypothetical protein
MSLPSANFSPPASPRRTPETNPGTAQTPAPSRSLELASTTGPLVDHQHPVLVSGDAVKATKEEIAESFYAELTKRLWEGEEPTQAMLDEAINGGSVEAIKLLVKLGVDVNGPIDWHRNTRLHLACRNYHVDQVNLLIQGGAKPVCENWNREIPIHLVLHDVEFQESPESQYAVLREFARKRFGAGVVLLCCKEVDRWDFVALMLAEGLLRANELFYDDRILEELLLNLKGVFKGALKSNSETIIRNCVHVLYYIIQFSETSKLADQTRQVLGEWSKNAGEIVRTAYEECPSKIFF